MSKNENVIIKQLFKFFVGFLFFLASARFGISQETSPYYLLPEVSQQSFSNPAVQNESEKLVIGLPFVSGISGNWNANVPFDALFSKDFSYSFERFYNELESQGKFNSLGRIPIFYASLRHNEYTFRLSVSERMVGVSKFDRDLVKFIRDGIKPYYGTNEYFGKADIHFQYFRELSFSVSKRVWESLDLGIASKILFGKLMLDGSDFELSVETLQEDKILLVKPDGNFISSGPFQLNNHSLFLANIHPGDYFFQPKNLGFAMDFGAVYRPDEFSKLSVSFLDLGFTTYNYNTFDIDFLNPARYSENDLFQSNYPDSEDYLEPREALLAYSDSLSDIVDSEDAENRTLMLMPVTVNLSAEYQFSEKITGGINNQFTWFENRPRNQLAAFIHSQVGEGVGLAGSLSMHNLTSIRPGFGVSWTLPQLQLYFSSNNILGIIQPTSSKHLNLSVGINLLFDTQ
jgi:hypothetical protein